MDNCRFLVGKQCSESHNRPWNKTPRVSESQKSWSRGPTTLVGALTTLRRKSAMLRCSHLPPYGVKLACGDEAPESGEAVHARAAAAAGVRLGRGGEANGNARGFAFPARFQRFAANPCPCGRGHGEGLVAFRFAAGAPGLPRAAWQVRSSTASTCSS